MPSFDIVSEVDLQEARNAVDNASREVESRFDFRGVEATFELNDANKTIKVLSESDFQVNQLLDILRAKLLKRGIEGTSLDVPEDIVHSGKTWFVEAKLKQGIESAVQKKIVKLIKDSKLKVQAQIQGEEIRVTGKSRDDLQSVMALVRGGDLGQPFQFKTSATKAAGRQQKRGIPRFLYPFDELLYLEAVGDLAVDFDIHRTLLGYHQRLMNPAGAQQTRLQRAVDHHAVRHLHPQAADVRRLAHGAGHQQPQHRQQGAQQKHGLRIKETIDPAAKRAANRHAEKLAGGVDAHRGAFVARRRLFAN